MTEQRLSAKKSILLTGAAGGIGSAFFRFAAEHYTFRLADIRPTVVDQEDAGEHEVVAFDIADPEACQHACRDIDIVLHLAADPSPHADFYGSLLSNNIQGTYNIFRAAKDQGCQRVIFASSVQVFSAYPADVQLHPEAPLRPLNMYGVSKCFGEAVASYFASAEGLSSIAVRIGVYNGKTDPTNPLLLEPNPRYLSAYVSARDLNRLLVRCIETPDVSFAVVHGLSDNRFKRLDITSTREVFAYQPQDDAFQIFQTELPRWLQN